MSTAWSKAGLPGAVGMEPSRCRILTLTELLTTLLVKKSIIESGRFPKNMKSSLKGTVLNGETKTVETVKWFPSSSKSTRLRPSENENERESDLYSLEIAPVNGELLLARRLTHQPCAT